MSDNFEASNGYIVRLDEMGDLEIVDPDGYPVEWVRGEELIAATAEYFQAERDEELGRWRDSVAPEYSCYPHEDQQLVVIINETTGGVHTISREDPEPEGGSEPWDVSRRYFEEHPLPDLRPWERAKVGEVWALVIEDYEIAATYGTDDKFYTAETSLAPTDPTITDGRRIWPEEGADD